MEWVKLFNELEKTGGEIPLKSTRQEIMDFKDNKVWQDVKEQLILELIKARDEFERLGEGHDRNEISYLQGQCFAIRSTLEMPDTLINSIKTEGEESDEPS